jgi:ATP dependent DNA ligase C terminal region
MPTAQTGVICEKCETAIDGRQEWCPRCGWYPRLKRHVELDPWDRENAPEQTPPSHLELWRKLIPLWAWKLSGGVAVIVALSVLARVSLPHHGQYRFRWTIAQMVIGDIVMLSGYIGAYLFAIMENDRITLLDFLLKPIAIWGTVARELPKTFWRVALGSWGLAAVASAFIVGGLADKDLTDWGGETAKFSLVKAITSQAQQLAENGNDEGLEKAIDDFAGPSGNPAANGEPVTPPKPHVTADCLIVGFEPDGNRDFKSLILATEVDGKLTCVGIVSAGIPQEVRDELNQRMRKLKRSDPFVPNHYVGEWVQPKLVCRVTATEWSSSKRLVTPKFEKLLADIPLGR